jgi:hypothetical protein
LQNRKTLVCVFWCFKSLFELKLTWDFLDINILSWEPSGAQEANEGGHEIQTSTGGAGQGPGHATRSCLSLEAPMPSTFVSWCSTWPKNSYVKTPRGIFERRWGRKIKHINRGCSSEDWSGKRCRSRPGRFSNLSNTTPLTPPWRESSPPLDYGLLAVAWSIYLLYMLWCLDVIWAAQHDYGTYYVIPIRWIFILSDDLWDMICYYVLDVWVDA